MSLAALNIAQTGLSAQEQQLAAISNDIANSQTRGYKSERVEFSSLMYQQLRDPSKSAGNPVTGVQVGTGVSIVGTSKDFSQGTINMTHRPLDIMISGDGFLQVSKPNGQTYYTRNGQLKLDADGRLVTNLNQPIEPEITIPSDAKDITVSRDGTVSVKMPGTAEPQEVGKIELARFVNTEGLKAIGDNLYEQTKSSGEPILGDPASDGMGDIMQYALEGSNVNTVSELVDLITVQRAYELNSKVIKSSNDMLSYASQKIGS